MLVHNASYGGPVPDVTTAKNGLDYQSNSKHTKGGGPANAGIEPKNSLELFGNSVLSSKPDARYNANCVVRSNGEIEITDWDGYPQNGPKPDGKLKLIHGDDYKNALKAKKLQIENIIDSILNTKVLIFMKYIQLNLEAVQRI